MTNIKLNSIERPCQTSAASQIVCSVFKNRIYTFEENIVKSKSEKQRARETHIKILTSVRRWIEKNKPENIVDQLIFA
jgi:hypothetical protein